MKRHFLPIPDCVWLSRWLCLLCLSLIAACSGSGNDNTVVVPPPAAPTGLTGCADTNNCASNPGLQIGGARIAQAQIPSDYTTSTRYPLIIVLHGFRVDGAVQAAYLGLTGRVDSKQYVLVMPDGTKNRDGDRFWNATPACCAIFEEDKMVDDVAYIRALIKEAAATYSIDTSRIGLIGHSNGGFMALRMVCEASDLVTSAVSLAGSTFADDASCTPASTPVSVLTMHGDADDEILYQGGEIGGNAYPAEPVTTRRFAAHAHCDTDHPELAPNVDVVGNIDGAETTVLEYTGCAPGVDVTLWTMQGVSHIPLPWVASALDQMVESGDRPPEGNAVKVLSVWLRHWLCMLSVILISACGGGSGGSNTSAVEPTKPAGLTGCADTKTCASNPTLQIGGERVAQVQIPSNYTTTTRYPLLIALNGTDHAAYLGLTDRVDRDQYVLVIANSSDTNDEAQRWNATPTCCASGEYKSRDDVAYLRGLIAEAAATYSIDTSRIGLIGHSNGGFMALRMVCDASELITSVVSLAGSTFVDDASCKPASTPVSVLTIHGDKDAVILYEGGLLFGNGYPGAQETTRRFAAHAKCNTDNPVLAPNIDVVADIEGAETSVLEYSGCAPGVDVTLWTMHGAPHVPNSWVPSALDRMVDWVIDHPRR